MTTTTHEPLVSAPQQLTDNKQVARAAAPSPPVSVPVSRGTVVARRSGKRRAWLVVLTLLVLAAGAGFGFVSDAHRGWLNCLGTRRRDLPLPNALQRIFCPTATRKPRNVGLSSPRWPRRWPMLRSRLAG